MSDDMHKEIIGAYKKKVLFTTHALNQMNLSDRMILREEVIETILEGNVIEEYSDDPRGGKNNGMSLLWRGNEKGKDHIHAQSIGLSPAHR